MIKNLNKLFHWEHHYQLIIKCINHKNNDKKIKINVLI